MEIKAKRACYFMLAPFMILFLIFTVVPVASAVFLSFTHFNMLEMPRWIGFSNYARLILDDQIFLKIIQNTLVFAVITGPLSYLFSFIFAWFINDLRPKLRSVMTLVFYLPSLSGNLFLVWAFIFSNDAYGFVNSTLRQLGFIQDPIEWLTNERYVLGVLIIVQLWLSLGAGFLAFIAGFQSIDRSLYEASAIDGVRNRWQELIFVTIPSMGPQLLFGAVMQISVSFGVSRVIMALAGFPTIGYSADTVVTYILDYGTVRYEMGYASAIAVLLFTAILFLNAIITKTLRKKTNFD